MCGNSQQAPPDFADLGIIFEEAQEPALGTAALRAECSKLEAENLAMHQMAEQSRQLRAEAGGV